MTDDQDHEFFDIMYQQWANTPGAKESYWMPIPIESYDDGSVCDPTDGGNFHFDITAVPINETEGDFSGRQFIGSVKTEEAADFICGLHGALPDLIRRLHEAVDEAARKDEANDVAQGQLLEALLENQGLREQVRELEKRLEVDPEDVSRWDAMSDTEDE